MSSDKYSPGQLVKLIIKNRCYTHEGFAVLSTYGIKDPDAAEIYAEIDIRTFPSHDDFRGEATIVHHNDIATIVSLKGRPWMISSDPRWHNYDVYEVLVNGCIRDIFAFNLELY